MKKLKTDINGGFPFELDDLRWIGQGLDESFKGLTEAFAKNDAGDFVLSGCALSNISFPSGSIQFDITAGYIVIDGEVCKVEAGTGIVVSGAAWYFDIDTTDFDAAGNETFENATTNDTYQKRPAKIVGGSSIPSGRVSALQFGTKTLASKIATLVANETFDFSKFIKFGVGSTTISSVNALFGDKNFVVVDFDGTVTNLKSGSLIASGKTGTLVLAKFNKTGTSDTIVLNHNDPTTTAGYARFYTKTRDNVTVYDGDIVVLVFDGTYWNILSHENKLLTKIINIGDWQMNTDDTVVVAHGLSNYKKIRSVSVVIRDDNDVNYFDFASTVTAGFAPCGAINGITVTSITLFRYNLGTFKSNDFDSTSYNRGWITIQYLP